MLKAFRRSSVVLLRKYVLSSRRKRHLTSNMTNMSFVLVWLCEKLERRHDINALKWGKCLSPILLTVRISKLFLPFTWSLALCRLSFDKRGGAAAPSAPPWLRPCVYLNYNDRYPDALQVQVKQTKQSKHGCKIQ